MGPWLTLLLILLGGCATTTGSFCQIEHPLRLSDASIEAMTDAEVADVLTHNRIGERLCGWKR